MRHINPFPSFTREECDDLRKKIVNGVAMETFVASPIAHRTTAAAEGKAWVKAPCWIHAAQWQDGKGFKKFKYKGHSLYIHRTSCELFNGPVLSTHLVDHLCRVRGCCQPEHLEAVTPVENIKRGANQNHLLRKGEKPPCAKDINPRFFEEPAIQEVNYDHHRRVADGRDGPPRYWEDNGGNPPPPPPAGFFWEKATGWTVGYTHILQPDRSGDPIYMAHNGDEVHVERANAAAAQMAAARTPGCYTAHGVSGYTGPVAEQWAAGSFKVDIMNGPSGPAYCDDAGCEAPRDVRSWWRRQVDALKTWLDQPVFGNKS